MFIVDYREITVPEGRQRKEFKPEKIVELANSISSIGLIHPIVVRREGGKVILVAGERRLKALTYVWTFGNTVRCGLGIYGENEVPCIDRGEMTGIEAYELELEENVRREDLTWQESAQATSQLYELRRLQAEKRGETPPTVAELASEIRGDSGSAHQTTKEEIIVSKHLDDPDVAKASSVKEAFKVLKRKEEAKKVAELGESVGKTYSPNIHEVVHGNCLRVMQGYPDNCVDVFLTDPPYGIDADQFGDSGGRVVGAHFYKDDFQTWSTLMQDFGKLSFRLAKQNAHAYVFCDVDNFVFLKSYMSAGGWKCFRTPLVWVNPTAMRTPWIDMGPQRKYQLCLFAVKGDRLVNKICPDVVTFSSDENLGHPAQKPVDLYKDFLARSVRPGDTVMDPFCGSGPIFPAAHQLKCKAIGIEQDDVAYGISVKRIQTLGDSNAT